MVRALRGEIYSVCNLFFFGLLLIKSFSDGKKPASVLPPPVGATSRTS